ncbi:LLM class F420-dependent oxidoreductase [Galbitalea sp. SE-J8]|uniref:LLM class F420-dependent oxidoreductase n=1 Tax=Galbitalea sp. SE-J8 TaxID=3054952 RepID=UPI00259C6DE2|nr:LLM class F420-dependent oxidoreductase [Galbitalea sp. SE-J8]MDM4763965.1 LLM class F420-dependent oxidoreductase [Galbitalea sp. SE-J8]
MTEFVIFTEPQQGASYATQLAHAQAAEQLGFDAWFRSDHYMRMGGGDPEPGPTDAWTTLAGLARETSRIRLGTLVSSATHRYPAILAIQVAQVDAMSNGRVDFGLGTGWFEAEHRALGIPFPEKRFGPFEEQLEILTGLWSTPAGQTFSFAGEHYQLVDAPALPKPVQSPLPLIIGGGGARRTPELAARFASEYNIGFVDDATVAQKFSAVREAADAAGRSLRYSVARSTVVGASADEVARRAAAAGIDAASLGSSTLGGSVDELVNQIGRLAELGADRVYLQLMDMTDLDHLDLIGREVLPRVR